MSTMTTANQDVFKLIHIDASPAVVWRALTDARSVVSWMSAEALSMETSWQVGSPKIGVRVDFLSGLREALL